MSVDLKVAIADISSIIRAGLEIQLKKIPGFRFRFIEIDRIEYLFDTVCKHKPDVLIINPVMAAGYPLRRIKAESRCPGLKCIALLCSLTDQAALRLYDEQITLFDTYEDIKQKFDQLCGDEMRGGKENEEQQQLSVREKEIVVCVVKGMTNKEIADHLFLSTHTVITHRRNIVRKLQIHSVSGLTVYAIVNKLVELNEINLK